MPGIGLPQSAEIKLNGAILSPEVANKLIDVRVEQVVSSADRAVIRFTDADFKLIDDGIFHVADELVVGFGTDSNSVVRVFKGEVTAISIEQASNDRHELVIEAFDKSHRLARGAAPATYLNMTYSDVVTKLAGEFSMTTKLASVLSSPVHQYIVKTGTTTEFFNMIARSTGTSWHVDDGQIVFEQRATAAATITVEYGKDLIRFKARFSEIGHAKSVEVRGWDTKTKEPVVGKDTTELSSPSGGSTLDSVSSMRNKFSSAHGALLVSAPRARSQAEAESMAKAIGRRQSMGELTAKGVVDGNPAIKAGSTIKVKDVGTTMSGDYYLTAVEHLFGGKGDLMTRFTAGGIDNSSIVDLLHGSGGALVPWDRSGVVVGIVTNIDDANAPGGGMGGRVKVKFPTLSDTDESDWARVVSIGAGTERGIHFMPNVDDEVLVAFEQNDPGRPIVIGGLFNGKDVPWAPAGDVIGGDGKVMQWGIQSIKGNFMKFLDGDGDDKIGVVISLADGVTKLKIGKDMTQLIANNKPIEIKSGEASIVLKDGNITMKATKVTIESTAAMELKAGAKLDVKATAGTAIDGGPTLEVKASGSAKVTSGGILELKGSMTKIN